MWLSSLGSVSCCTYIWPHFNPYVIHISRCFHVKSSWEWVKLTSFESYRAYNMFYLTFRKNFLVLIERKILWAILGKNRGPTKPGRTDGSKTEDRTIVHCCTHLCQVPGAAHGRASDYPVTHRPVLRSLPTSRAILCDFSSYFGGTSWLDFHERQLGLRIPLKTPLEGE